MSMVWRLVALELRRNRWMLTLAPLFFFVILVLAWLVPMRGGNMTELALMLVAGLGAFLFADCAGGEANGGTQELLFALPVAPWVVWLVRYGFFLTCYVAVTFCGWCIVGCPDAGGQLAAWCGLLLVLFSTMFAGAIIGGSSGGGLAVLLLPFLMMAAWPAVSWGGAAVFGRSLRLPQLLPVALGIGGLMLAGSLWIWCRRMRFGRVVSRDVMTLFAVFLLSCLVVGGGSWLVIHGEIMLAERMILAQAADAFGGCRHPGDSGGIMSTAWRIRNEAEAACPGSFNPELHAWIADDPRMPDLIREIRDRKFAASASRRDMQLLQEKILIPYLKGIAELYPVEKNEFSAGFAAWLEILQAERTCHYSPEYDVVRLKQDFTRIAWSFPVSQDALSLLKEMAVGSAAYAEVSPRYRFEEPDHYRGVLHRRNVRWAQWRFLRDSEHARKLTLELLEHEVAKRDVVPLGLQQEYLIRIAIPNEIRMSRGTIRSEFQQRKMKAGK